jgi:ribosome modulation factor
MTNNEAFDQGYDAYWDGVDISDNPFDEETEDDARLAWDQGWRKARQHDYDEDDG